MTVAHIAAENNWGLGSELARRFLKRDNYKCFELPSTSTGNIGRNKLERFRAALRQDNLYFIEDIVSQGNYKQYAVTDINFLKNLLIKKEGEYECLGNVSSLLKGPVARVARIYFRNEEDRDAAKLKFQTC